MIGYALKYELHIIKSEMFCPRIDNSVDALCFWRALAGKHRKVLAQYWKLYFANVARLGRDEWLSVKLAKMIDEFSHEQGYERKVGIRHTLIAYWMAWIKRHYRDEYELLFENL